MPDTAGAHCLGLGCGHDATTRAPRANATPLRGRHAVAGRRERLRPSLRVGPDGQSRRPTESTRTTAAPSSADASRSTSAVMPQS